LREDLFTPDMNAGKIDIGQDAGLGMSSKHFEEFIAAQNTSTLTARIELTK